MRIASGQIMTQTFASCRRPSARATSALIFAAVLSLAPAVFTGAANAQALGYSPALQTSFPPDSIMTAPADSALPDERTGSTYVLPERLRRTVVGDATNEPPGTVKKDTRHTHRY
jgi:hypothetical protein